MTPEQQLARTKRLVSAAKALLSLQSGLAIGAIRIDNLLRLLPSDIQTQHKIYRDFLSAIPSNIPLGNARLYWAGNALLETDKTLALIEEKFREKLLLGCIQIIETYDAPCRAGRSSSHAAE